MENFFMETPSNEIIFILGSGFFYVFTMGSISRRFCFFSRSIISIFLCCYGMEWLLWRRLSLFFSVRRTWKINEVFKVFQIPLDLNLEAGTQTRKSNLLQIFFCYKLSSSPFFVVFKQFPTKFCSIVHIYAIAQCLHGQEKAPAFKKQFWASGLAKLFPQQNIKKERSSAKFYNLTFTDPKYPNLNQT